MINRLKIMLLSVCFINTGCSFMGPATTEFTSKDQFSNPYLSFNAPPEKWYTFSNRDEWTTNKQKTSFWKSLFRDLPKNGSLSITVNAYPNNKNEPLLNKNTDFKKSWEKLYKDPKRIERHKEMGITYDKHDIQYVKGLKCSNSISSRGYGGDLYSATSKSYSLFCGYYHKIEGIRTFYISYEYYGASGVSKLQKQVGIKASDIPPLSEAERVLKEDVRTLINSLVLKDVDWERMEKEGLLHNKAFKSTHL